MPRKKKAESTVSEPQVARLMIDILEVHKNEILQSVVATLGNIPDDVRDELRNQVAGAHSHAQNTALDAVARLFSE